MLAPETIAIYTNCFRVCGCVILVIWFAGIALNRMGKTAYSCAFNELIQAERAYLIARYKTKKQPKLHFCLILKTAVQPADYTD
jgi:hypothetical protein